MKSELVAARAGLWDRLDISLIPDFFHKFSRESFANGDIDGVLVSMDNHTGLAFVHDNIFTLRDAGLYESALISAYTACRTNWHRWQPEVLRFMFLQADRDGLMACGDPLPGKGPWTIYRGVAGQGRARRLRGISWTADKDKAIWFAARFAGEPQLAEFSRLASPAVVSCEVSSGEVYAYSNERGEREFLCILDKDKPVKHVWQG